MDPIVGEALKSLIDINLETMTKALHSFCRGQQDWLFRFRVQKMKYAGQRDLDEGDAMADDQLTALLAAGSHDLRGPVHHIQAYVRLLQDDHTQLAPDRLGFMLGRLLRAADTVAAEFNSLTLWAKARQGALADLAAAPDETLEDVLDEYRQGQVLAVELQGALPGGQLCPGLLFRMILVQVVALAAEIDRGPLPVALALQDGALARWVFTWQAPPVGDGSGTAGSAGTSARARLHLAALGHLAAALRGDLSTEAAPDGGFSLYRLTVPAG